MFTVETWLKKYNKNSKEINPYLMMIFHETYVKKHPNKKKKKKKQTLDHSKH